MLSKETMNIEIGIIVPVYNAQQSLHKVTVFLSLY